MNVRQAMYSFMPSVVLSGRNTVSTGRVLDPTTYDFLEDKTIYDMNAAIGGSMIVFSGFKNIRTAKLAKTKREIASVELSELRQELAVSVVMAFMEMALQKENIKICESKVASLKSQEEVILWKIEADTATEGELLSIRADIAGAEAEVITARSNYESAKLDLCLLMQDVPLEKFDIKLSLSPGPGSVPQHFISISNYMSVNQNPKIRKYRLAQRQADQSLSLAYSDLWPTLSLNLGYGSTFSSARTVPLTGAAYSFWDQIKNNSNSYATLSLTIPILNVLPTRNTIRLKKIERVRSANELRQAEIDLETEIQKQFLYLNAALKKMELLDERIRNGREAVEFVSEKFSMGLATYIDYQTAMENLFQAEILFAQVQIELIFRMKVLDLYRDGVDAFLR